MNKVIHRIHTKYEFDHLMNLIERKRPNINWSGGQSPTSWHPDGVYKCNYENLSVVLDKQTNKLFISYNLL